jgi:hypothetical protein
LAITEKIVDLVLLSLYKYISKRENNGAIKDLFTRH